MKLYTSPIHTLLKVLLSMIVFLSTGVFANDPIILTENKNGVSIGLSLDYLEDKDGSLSIKDIVNPDTENLWQKSNSEVPNFGFTYSHFWFRAKIQNHHPNNTEWILEIPSPVLDNIDFYISSNSQEFKTTLTGDRREFHSREYYVRNFLFDIPIEPGSEKFLYIKIWSEGGLLDPMPVNVYPKNQYFEISSGKDTIMGIYFGIIAVMILYNLFIFISVKDISYFYYILYLISFLAWSTNYFGYAFQYFPFYRIDWDICRVVLFLIFSIMILLFSRSFLSAQTFAPKHSFFLKLGVILFSILIPFSFFLSLSTIWQFGMLLSLINCLLLIATGISCYRKGFRPAAYYLLAWTFLLFSGILVYLRASSIMQPNFFTENSFLLGSGLEVILLSLGLADRINELKRQNSLSQQKALEAEKRSSQIKDEFLSNLSHEINTPLSIVYAYSELLTSNEEYPQDVIQYSGEIHSSARKLSDYVSDLMLVTDIESNFELKKSPVELSSIFKNVNTVFQPLIDEKKIQLDMKIPDKLKIDLDKALFEKAVLGIIKNAIVYNQQNGKINVFVSVLSQKDSGANDNLSIKVIDTGIGILPEFHSKIFEKFFRVDSAITYEVSGVGLGLFLSKKIVEMHNGTINLKSHFGGGSEFEIIVPIHSENK